MSERHLALHVSDPAWFRQERAFLSSHRVHDLMLPFRPRVEMEETAARAVQELSLHAFPTLCDRIYLGNEFCPYLEWSDEEVLCACELAADNGFQLSLVSGVTPECDFSRRLGLVRRLAARFGAMEVVANDWGFLSTLSGLGVMPVAGRLLFRNKRLPRLSRSVLPDALDPGLVAGEVAGAQLTELAECPWDAPWERYVAARVGLSRADVEMTPQGLRAAPGGLPLSLHLPFTFVTGGGACPVAQLRVRDGRTTCSRRCRSTAIQPRFPVRTWSLVQVGQTVFFSSHSLAGHYLSMERIDRIVLEPGLPM